MAYEWLQPLDAAIMPAFQTLVDKCPTLNLIVWGLSRDGLLQLGILVLPLWYFWFAPSAHLRDRRNRILDVTLASFIAMAAGRLLQELTPDRERPYDDPASGFVTPSGVDLSRTYDSLRDFSSFPSDHALLYFSLAVGMCFVSRRAGLLCLVWVAIVGMLPRIYIGIHYPSDIVVGAIIGSAIAVAVHVARPLKLLYSPVLRLAETAGGAFYAGAFTYYFLIMTLFDDIRAIGHGLSIVAVRVFAR